MPFLQLKSCCGISVKAQIPKSVSCVLSECFAQDLPLVNFSFPLHSKVQYIPEGRAGLTVERLGSEKVIL